MTTPIDRDTVTIVRSDGTTTTTRTDDGSSARHAYWRRKVERIRARGLLDDEPQLPGLAAAMGDAVGGLDQALVIRIIVRDHPSDFPGGIAEFGLA